MALRHAGWILAALVGCAGCGREYVVERMTRVPIAGTVVQATANTPMVVLSSDRLRQRRIQIDRSSAEFTTAYAAATGASAEAAQAGRDRIAFAMLQVSDELCQHHIGQMRSISTTTNLAFGTLTSIFASGASLVTGSLGQNYAAVAATSNSLRGLFNDEVYRRALAENIALLIENERSAERRILLAELAKPSAQYSIHRAMYDIELYHSHCSLLHGLSRAAEAINNAGKSDAASPPKG